MTNKKDISLKQFRFHDNNVVEYKKNNKSYIGVINSELYNKAVNEPEDLTLRDLLKLRLEVLNNTKKIHRIVQTITFKNTIIVKADTPEEALSIVNNNVSSLQEFNINENSTNIVNWDAPYHPNDVRVRFINKSNKIEK